MTMWRRTFLETLPVAAMAPSLTWAQQAPARKGRLKQSVTRGCFGRKMAFEDMPHTAGNPGRHEMDGTQELNYRGIASAIADAGFQGFAAHEYPPLGDPLESLEKTFKMFEV
jgi:hypothetical protein